MRSKKRTIGILIVVIVILLGFASSLLVYRNKLSSEKTKNNSNNNTAQSLSSSPSGISIENFYDKPITDEKIALDSIEVNRDKLGYSDKNFTFIYDEKSSSETAYHFDLYYKDIPVYSPVGIRGVSVITYYDNSADVLITGVSDSEKITKINTIPKITQDEASKIIKNELNLSEKTYIEPKLIIYEVNEECILAYYVNTLFNVCIINAENGNIVVCQSTLLSNSDEFIGQNGDKHRIFYDDYQDGNYNIENALWDKEKNIFIYNNICTYEEIKMKENILSLEDIQSDKNKSAVDGMANTYRAVEYFEKLNKELGSIFNLICVNVNAELKDEKGNIIQNQAMGGYHKIDGNDICILSFCVMSDDVTPQFSAYLDAVAHEYTHAVTNLKVFGSDGHSEDRRYFERNALREAYSDIFGELVEQRYTGETDWNSNKTRNLINQEKGKDYKNYKNYYRYNYDDRYIGTSDDGGAHYNSTIISHAAYLMSKDHKSIKHSSYGSTKNLLDYDQLGQLWYGSLEYLKETEFMDFSDCRYAVEKSARKLIKEGVLLEDNLKVIEQAFNEVEVSSNPIRRGAKDSAEIIKDKHTLVVPIEEETQSTEFVEITELNYAWHISPTIEAEDIILSDKEEIQEGNLQNYKYASSEYSIIKNNSKYGIIKYDGTLLTNIRYDSFSMPNNKEMWIVNENSHENPDDVIITPNENSPNVDVNLATSVGFMDYYYTYSKDKNKLFIDGHDFESYFNTDYNVVVEQSEKEYINSQNKNALYGIADKDGIIIPCEYENACMNIGNNIIALEKNGKWGFFDKNGTKIIDFICEPFESKVLDDTWRKASWDNGEIYPYLASNGYIPVKINGKCGYYDTQGNEVIPCGTFEEVRPVHNGLAWVKKDGKWGVIKLKDIEKPETDYQKQYYTFIENELIPKYGLANVDTDIPISKSNGIVSTVIDDFSNTGSMDLLVIRLENSAESIETICEWYTLKGDTVVPVDEITVKSGNGITSNIDISFNQGYLCFTSNRIWLNSNNAESSIWIYSFDSSKLTPLRNYEIHRFNGYVDEIVETIKKEINIKSQDYMLALNDVKVFQDDLKSLGIEFNNEQVDCQLINRNNFLNYTLSIRESLFENCRFMITDYTNLQSHLTNTDNNNSSGNKNWQQFYADELKRYMNSDEYNNESMFDLYDIDNDGTPELFISEGGLFISLNTICTVFNGNMIKSSGNFNCIYCGGVDNLQLQVSQSTKTVRSGGIGIISYQKLENGQFISIFEGYENNKDNGENDKEYIVNGEIVTAERYNEEKLKYRYSADDYVDVGRKYKLDEVTINSVLLNT